MARFRERSIIIYHQIGDYPAEKMLYGVTPGAFRTHLDFLAESGLEILSLDRMIAQMRGEAPWSPRAISLTFDGGFRDGREEALPLLLERNIRAAFFVPTDFIGKEHGVFGGPFPCMDWGALRELSEAGMTIGSFGRRGMTLDRLPQNEWREDARAARQTLEDGLGVEVPYHAYMEQFPDRRLRGWFVEQGFRAVLTQCPTFRRPDPYRIGRVQMDDEDVNILKTKTSNLYLFFKDRRTWRFIRRRHLDRLMHRVYSLFER